MLVASGRPPYPAQLSKLLACAGTNKGTFVLLVVFCQVGSAISEITFGGKAARKALRTTRTSMTS